MKIDREAIQFFLAFLFIGIVIFLFAGELAIISYIFFFLSLFTIYFFRDPKRKIPESALAIVSPADGKIIKIEETSLGDKKYNMVSIFMSVFNVHINRSPFRGTVKSIRYNPGKFLPAFKDKASLQNEQTEIIIHNKERGCDIPFRMIAGIIARRIVVRVKEGQNLTAGEKVGLIRFGSRVDVFIPCEAEIKVKAGDNVKGGNSVIGEFK